MLLNQILADCGLPAVFTDIEITGVTPDSRKVEKGFLFAALPGVKADGADFLTDACGKGAVAALIPDTAAVPDLPMIFIPVADPRLALAKAAAAFYAPQPDVVVAVTGTNGKTSTANFTRQIWEFLGKKAACVGTLGVVTNDFTAYGSLTTPDSVTLCRELRDLAVKGYRHAAIEASSHGLDQHRIDGLRIAAAAFTNITRDHLDYHKTMENYLRAKLKLFDRPLSSRTVVLNADIPEYPRIAEYCREKGLKIIDYGKNAAALKLKESRMDTNGQMLTLDVFGRERTVNLPLAGTFQAMNALCALGLAIAAGEDAERATAALAELKGAPGRLEFIGERKNGASVFVDYAHTPDALETVLKALRPHTEKRLHVVFGCGGDRDAGKRPQMGKICNDLADVVYVADDNPRGEDPAAIRAAILPACPKGIDIGNRALAIRAAVAGLDAGDILVIAGKGHETGQLIKGVTHPFDDREEARKAIDEADAPLWTAREIAGATGGETAADFDVSGVSIDTRTLKPGDLFVAIKGEKTDGHDYAAAAIEKGAAGVLASYIPADVPPEKAIVVPDVKRALDAMAARARSRTAAKIVGVTGSSGKTSTKEMLKAALSAVGKTHSTIGNLNNNLGMPLTLARMPRDADFAVVEMGISHAGEMTELTELARPDVALITMIGSAHCEYFKTPENTARAKAEIFKGVTASGTAVLNADDPQFALLKKEARKCGVTNIVSFGSTAEADVSLINLAQTPDGFEITVKTGSTVRTFLLRLSGRHQVQNALGVVAALDALGVGDMTSALQAVGQLRPMKGRGQILSLPCRGGAFSLIDDSYNANPDSVRAGVRVLAAAGGERKIAVLGDMLELGESAEQIHKDLADDLIENKIDLVFAVGENCGKLFDVLPERMRGAKAALSSEIAPVVAEAVKPGDAVLVKGSFGSKMTAVVDALKNISNLSE